MNSKIAITIDMRGVTTGKTESIHEVWQLVLNIR